MTDLEITKKCAEKMGYVWSQDGVWANGWYRNGYKLEGDYDPLHDDGQMVALVKKFKLDITHNEDGTVWASWFPDDYGLASDFEDATDRHIQCKNQNLNYAICECVAMMADRQDVVKLANQCDGCMRGLPVDDKGYHHDEQRFPMLCTKDKYV